MGRPLRVALVGQRADRRASGIGRVLQSLLEQWAGAVEVAPAALTAPPLPLLRNLPGGVAFGPGARPDLALLPQLTGAQALRSTGGVPSLAIVHDIGVVDCPADRAHADPLTRLIVRQGLYGLRHATGVVAVSEFTRRRLLAAVPGLAGRVAAIPSGAGEAFLSYDEPREAARRWLAERLGAALGAPLLIYVGSELPRKNVGALLEALCRLRQAHPGAQLLKVGAAGGPDWRERTLAAARRLGLAVGRDLLIAEGLDDGGLAAAYRAADLFVTASLYEGFGLPALEALAVGTPVVVTDRGALPEVVGGAGLVAPAEAAALAAAAAAALGGAAARGEAARAHAARYRWRDAAAAYLELMGRLAARGRSA